MWKAHFLDPWRNACRGSWRLRREIIGHVTQAENIEMVYNNDENLPNSLPVSLGKATSTSSFWRTSAEQAPPKPPRQTQHEKTPVPRHQRQGGAEAPGKESKKDGCKVTAAPHGPAHSHWQEPGG